MVDILTLYFSKPLSCSSRKYLVLNIFNVPKGDTAFNCHSLANEPVTQLKLNDRWGSQQMHQAAARYLKRHLSSLPNSSSSDPFGLLGFWTPNLEMRTTEPLPKTHTSAATATGNAKSLTDSS